MQLEDSLVPPGTSFQYHEEVKQTVGARRVLKVYLVDKEGKKHLAATGEDLGDAHYHYRSSKPFRKFGVIDCHNRKELTQWLEMIIAETSNKEGPHLDVSEHNPEGVYFTSYKYERAHMADGRRINRWCLVDQHGSAHLAVIGIERDTKDGHYTYSAEEPFASRIPLQCSNQSGVFKWLEKWITHHAAGTAAGAAAAGAGATKGNEQAPSGTMSTAGSVGSGMDSAGRKPPLFISLSAIRAARKSATALLAANATMVDPAVPKPVKPSKPPPSKSAAAAVVATPGAQESGSGGPKSKSIGIVQQNQLKKARKLQEDAKAEQERLVTGHLTRLRRAAAAELQGDNAAKQVSMSWLQGGLTRDEYDVLEHWVTLLGAVLDLQQKQQQAADSAEPPPQQQQQPGPPPAEQPGGGRPAAAADESGPQQQQPAGAQAPQQQGASSIPSAGGAVGEGLADKELLAWLQQPGNERHHLRVMLECLKEIGAADLPARVLLGHKVVALVQRCLSAAVDESVKSLATHMLQRWRWQLAGHMQVLTNPTYMEDHLGVLDEEVAAGAVPLPQLPAHKQALLKTALPTIPGAASGRMHYTPAHSHQQQHHHHHHHQQQHHHAQQQQQQPAPGSAAALAAAAAAAGRAAASAAQLHGGVGLLGQGHDVAAQAQQVGFDGPLGQQTGLGGALNPLNHLAAGFSTPLSALSGLYRSGSPALAAALGAQQSLLHAGSLGQPCLLSPGQQMALFSCPDSAVDPFGLNASSGLLTWPLASAGLPALAAGQPYALGTGVMPLLHTQQQQLQLQQSHFLGLQQQQQQQQQQQLYLQQQGLAAAIAAGPQAQGLLQQPLGAGQAQAALLAQQQQQQQQWLGFLQQPATSTQGSQQQQPGG